MSPVALFAGENESKGTVVLTISGIQNRGGSVMVALFSENDKFLKVPSFWKQVPISSQSTIEVTFTDIPFGIYAASIYHDLNENGELDSNMFMIPQEPIGFSNDYFPRIGPPKFKNASFQIYERNTKLTVALKTY